MYFLYVYTEATVNVGDDSIPVSITPSERDACVRKDVSVIRQCVEDNHIDWDTVLAVAVETEQDPDPDDPATMVCWDR